jgi:hypothetical protein
MIASKKRILVVLTTKEYMNNYLYTDALDLLLEKYQVTILIPETLIEFVPANRLNFTVTMPESVFKHHESEFRLLTDMYRRKYRSKSKSFAYREKRISYDLKLNIRYVRHQSRVEVTEKIRTFVKIFRKGVLRKPRGMSDAKYKPSSSDTKEFLASVTKFTRLNLGLLKAILINFLRKGFVKVIALGYITDFTQMIYNRKLKVSEILCEF